jgi:hypothetical protein
MFVHLFKQERATEILVSFLSECINQKTSLEREVDAQSTAVVL